MGLAEAAEDFALGALLSRAKSFHAVLNLNFEQGSMELHICSILPTLIYS